MIARDGHVQFMQRCVPIHLLLEEECELRLLADGIHWQQPFDELLTPKNMQCCFPAMLLMHVRAHFGPTSGPLRQPCQAVETSC